MNKIQIWSGGAYGADYELTKNLDGDKFEVHHLYTHLQKSPYGNECITREQFNESLMYIQVAANILGRKVYTNNLKYLARDYWIAKNSDVLIGIGHKTKNSELYAGGTGYTCEFSKMLNKPILMYDDISCDYYTYNFEPDDQYKWLKVKNIGLFGSRKLSTHQYIQCNNVRILLNTLDLNNYK